MYYCFVRMSDLSNPKVSTIGLYMLEPYRLSARFIKKISRRLFLLQRGGISHFLAHLATIY